MKLIAVTRIEAHPGSAKLDDPATARKLAELIVGSVRCRNASAVQVDFDARQSQRQFYAILLKDLRQRLPEGMPLSITALTSWCAYDDWIAGLPVDEVVPMFFRMGPDHPPSETPGWEYPIREPLCKTSAGVSSDEAWPKLDPGTKLYVFHRGPWNHVVQANIERHLP
jgi:hypothetical protein